MKRIKKPEFYAMYRNFNSGKVEKVEVLQYVLNVILDDKGRIKKKRFNIYDDKFNIIPVTTKEQFSKLVKGELMSMFWSRCEWEFIVVDWPYNEENKVIDEHPQKIDVYSQLEPNMDIIVDLLWNYIEPKIKK